MLGDFSPCFPRWLLIDHWAIYWDNIYLYSFDGQPEANPRSVVPVTMWRRKWRTSDFRSHFQHISATSLVHGWLSAGNKPGESLAQCWLNQMVLVVRGDGIKSEVATPGIMFCGSVVQRDSRLKDVLGLHHERNRISISHFSILIIVFLSVVFGKSLWNQFHVL